MPKTRTRRENTTATAGTAALALGGRLRELRLQRQLSQGDIEKRTGLLRCYISRVEGGYTVPSVETLEKFAAALSVPLYALFTQAKAAEIPAAAKAKASRKTPVDPYFEKLRRHMARMDDRDRDTFLSLVRKLAVMAA